MEWRILITSKPLALVAVKAQPSTDLLFWLVKKKKYEEEEEKKYISIYIHTSGRYITPSSAFLSVKDEMPCRRLTQSTFQIMNQHCNELSCVSSATHQLSFMSWFFITIACERKCKMRAENVSSCFLARLASTRFFIFNFCLFLYLVSGIAYLNTCPHTAHLRTKRAEKESHSICLQLSHTNTVNIDLFFLSFFFICTRQLFSFLCQLISCRSATVHFFSQRESNVSTQAHVLRANFSQHDDRLSTPLVMCHVSVFQKTPCISYTERKRDRDVERKLDRLDHWNHGDVDSLLWMISMDVAASH